jgi:hypothetical protein
VEHIARNAKRVTHGRAATRARFHQRELDRDLEKVKVLQVRVD